MAGIIVWVLMLGLFVAVVRRVFGRKRRGAGQRSMAGPGAVGTIYGLLNEDKRNAVEIIVEQKAAERRPEYPDGNLPDLESPKR